MSSPVATSASPLPNASVPLTRAIAPGSFCGRTSSRRTDRASGKIAVAAPWSTRPRISSGSEDARAAMTEPATITPSTATRVGFLPCWSPNRPSSGVKTAADSSVAVVTQLTLAVVVPRSSRMRPRIGTGRVCIIDTTMAARLRAKTMTVSFRCPEAGVAGEGVLMAGVNLLRVSELKSFGTQMFDLLK